MGGPAVSGRPPRSRSGDAGFYWGSPPGASPVLEARRRRPGVWRDLEPITRMSVVAIVVILLVAVLGSLIHVPYAVFSPGPVTNTLGSETNSEGTKVPRIEVEGAKTYPAKGRLDFTTVRVSGGPGFPVNVWEWIGARLDSATTVVPADQVFAPEQTREQIQAENEVAMRSSQDDATAVALRALDYTVPEAVVVDSLTPDSPAKDSLKRGDILRRVEGAAVADAASVRDQLAKLPGGSSVRLDITREGKKLTVTSPTKSSPEGRTVLGVVLSSSFDFPVEVTVDAGNVGGPSAGLMFALGIYDVLTPGNLTGGKPIAGTGTIDAAGKVGPIGGIKQKVIGAQDAGAVAFLAPADNCAELDAVVPPDIEVYSVKTFDQAKTAVTAIGKGKKVALERCG